MIFLDLEFKGYNLLFFLFLLTIYVETTVYMETKDYKRTSRAMSPETRQKISTALKGRPKSQAWKEKISAGQKRAWAAIPRTNETDCRTVQ